MSVVKRDMSPQQHTRESLTCIAEQEAQSMLGVPLPTAMDMLDRGDLRGTAAEAEMRMLRFLLDA
jgi:hypothetical protein